MQDAVGRGSAGNGTGATVGKGFRMKRSIWTAVALGVGMLAPAAANADTYLVASCHDPSGQPNAALGWVPFSTPGGVTSNTCGADGALNAALPEAAPPGNSTANWRFDAPAGTRIVRVSAQRKTSGLSTGPTSQQKDISYFMAASGGQTLEDCTPAPSGSSCIADLTAPIDKQGLSSTFVEFRTLCLNAGGACSRPIGVAATHMWVTLDDIAAPAVANFKLLDNGDSSGVMRMSFDAADVGGGVYRALIKVDGKVASTVPLAAAPCADIFTTDDDPYQFNVPVPCPAAIPGATVAVDVRSLPAGPHGVEVAVEDAAGNQRSVFGPVEFPKLNATGNTGSGGVSAAQAINGRLRMWFVKARNRGSRLTSRYGTRVVTRGILQTRNGRAIQGARIDVYHIRNGKRRLLKTGLKSRAGGKLTLILPLNVDTRTIEYDYRALRPGPVTSSQKLTLRVMRNGRLFHRR
jgi:hypothetical protein